MADSTLKSLDANAALRRVRRRVDEALSDAFEPTASVAFTHLTTLVESTIPTAIVLGIGTTSSSGALIAATTALEDRINLLTLLVNQLSYVLTTNGLSS